MNLRRRFFRRAENEGKIAENAEDLFWGVLAILILVLAQVFSGISHWGGWFLLAAGVVSICLVREVLRAQLPLSRKQKTTRRTSLFIIFCLLLVCIMEFIGEFIPM